MDSAVHGGLVDSATRWQAGAESLPSRGEGGCWKKEKKDEID